MTFRVDAYPRDTFTGTVSQVRLEPVVAQNVVSYVTVIDVPNTRTEAEAGDDGERDRGNRARRQRAARAERGAALPADAESRRRSRARPQGAAGRVAGSGAPHAGAAAAGTRRRGRSARGGGGHARVWVMRDGQLQPVRVRPGISDGTTTAIVDGELTEDTQVVTGVATAAATAAATGGSSPLIPQRPGGGPGAGRPGAVTGAGR